MVCLAVKVHNMRKNNKRTVFTSNTPKSDLFHDLKTVNQIKCTYFWKMNIPMTTAKEMRSADTHIRQYSSGLYKHMHRQSGTAVGTGSHRLQDTHCADRSGQKMRMASSVQK